MKNTKENAAKFWAEHGKTVGTPEELLEGFPETINRMVEYAQEIAYSFSNPLLDKFLNTKTEMTFDEFVDLLELPNDGKSELELIRDYAISTGFKQTQSEFATRGDLRIEFDYFPYDISNGKESIEFETVEQLRQILNNKAFNKSSLKLPNDAAEEVDTEASVGPK